MLDITNYSDHPTRIGYTVFKFYEKQRADYFEELLKKDAIWYESSIDEDRKTIYLFGVKKSNLKAAFNANYLVSARYRKPIFPNVYFRWILLIVTIGLLILAIIGALKN